MAGRDVTLIWTPVGSYLFLADPGTFTLSGDEIDMRATRIGKAGEGAFLMTPADVSMVLNMLLVRGAGRISTGPSTGHRSKGPAVGHESEGPAVHHKSN
jgi:hypothetical protein